MSRLTLVALGLSLVVACGPLPVASPTPTPPFANQAELVFADENDPFLDQSWVDDMARSPATNLIVTSGNAEGLALRDASGRQVAALGSGSYSSLAVVGSTLYAGKPYPPRVQAWDLGARRKIAEWTVCAEPATFFGGWSKGPPAARVCLALAPSSGLLAVAYEETVSILDPSLQLLRQFRRPTFSGSPGLSATENGRDVTDRYYRFQSVFWEPGGRRVLAFVSTRMGAFGWAWDLDEEEPRPLPISGGAGVAPGQNSRMLVPQQRGTRAAHPRSRPDAWIEDEDVSSRVQLRTVDLPDHSWGRELVCWNEDGTPAWRHVFAFPSNAYRRFAVVGDRVLLAGGQGVHGGGRLATRSYDLATGLELE